MELSHFHSSTLRRWSWKFLFPDPQGCPGLSFQRSAFSAFPLIMPPYINFSYKSLLKLGSVCFCCLLLDSFLKDNYESSPSFKSLIRKTMFGVCFLCQKKENEKSCGNAFYVFQGKTAKATQKFSASSATPLSTGPMYFLELALLICSQLGG